jgi:hypothetical protein
MTSAPVPPGSQRTAGICREHRQLEPKAFGLLRSFAALAGRKAARRSIVLHRGSREKAVKHHSTPKALRAFIGDDPCAGTPWNGNRRCFRMPAAETPDCLARRFLAQVARMLPPKVRPKSWRVHLSLPGVLATVLPTRWAEFHYTSASPYIVELVCFDLRKRREHEITRPYADDPPRVQDAVDREIVAHYAPHRDRAGALIHLIFQRAGEAAANERARPGAVELPPGEMVVQRYWVFFPAILREAIEQRRQELGFRSVSAYVTSLVRYDMMLGGPHYYFSGKDKDPELLAALDLRTLRAFQEQKRQRILLDYLIERATGREMTDAERQQMNATYTVRLRENALRSQREQRRRG